MAKAAKGQFETAFGQLETLVKQLEGGDLPLEESLKAFEKGMQLKNQCQKILNEAEQKVSILMKEGEKETLKPFEGDA